ncbi:hypothetical protein I316_03689 [Kwoniella heveanensis BCC8398]|uniref:Uncharacterized protein n=1 Tax=Kwoniella heveanensis BCC8398 TaxID=1296120 RepID=A0A1B9GUB7_9TREE|nr:hypothetical protein I316_03689 [Kwoniella heveanensis BCC8398]
MSTSSDWRKEGIGPDYRSPSSTNSSALMSQAEAGPSRLPFGANRDVEPADSQPQLCGCEVCLASRIALNSNTHRRRRSRDRSRTGSSSSTATAIGGLLSYLPPFLLPFIRTADAAPAPAPAPPPTRPDRSIPSPTISHPSYHPSHIEYKRVQYLTSVSTPSILPTEAKYVDETVLPYLLTRHDDGTWRRADGGWSLYGKHISAPSTQPILADADGDGSVPDTSASTPPSYAVESVLPNGWGVSSNRTSIYKVPLIAIASVIMAMAIVALILFIVLGRRKRHRKQRRAKERLRRKALAAAGIKEDELNGSAAEAAFKEKLAELEKQHLAKKKRGGQAGLAVGKVRGWNSRMSVLRRRKGKGKGKEGGDVTIEVLQEDEDKPVDGVDESRHPPSPTSILERDPGEGQDDGSASQRPNRRSGDGDDDESPEGGNESIARSNGEQDEAASGAAGGIARPVLPPHFPPAYRPASVRSLPRDIASSSSAGPSHLARSNTDDLPRVPSGAEKIQAPGYYPAPATADGEVALAIASRSDGKARLVDPAPEDEREDRDRIRHIATDDKRVLEQLRLGASAPPEAGHGQAQFTISEDGPSAPAVQVDAEGFEQPEVDDLTLQAILDHAGPTIPPPASTLAGDSLLPPPPKLKQRFCGPSSQSFDPSLAPQAISSSPAFDDIHLLPSAPPMAISSGGTNLIPSAPPMLEDDGDGESQADAADGNLSPTPSAPVFEIGGDDSDSLLAGSLDGSGGSSNEQQQEVLADRDEDLTDGHNSHSHTSLPANEENRNTGSGVISRSDSGSGPTLFLPRYEP